MNRIHAALLALSLASTCSGCSSASIRGNWKLVSYGAPANPKPALPGVETSLSFDPDGKVHVNVGCNSIGGDYKIDGETITFGSITSTLMACGEPIMDQEGRTREVLKGSASFVLNENTWTMTSTDGKSVIVLARK